MTAQEVRAAGGVVWRRRGDDIEVLVVHRPRYGDWTFPKGKLEQSEDDETAARREVAEETGLDCPLGAELATTRYADRFGRPKVVRYWAMEAPQDIPFRPNHEVDRVAWLSPGHAGRRLTYPRDRAVLDSLVEAARM